MPDPTTPPRKGAAVDSAHEPFGPQPHADKTPEQMSRDELDEVVTWGKQEQRYSCNPPLRLRLSDEQRSVLLDLHRAVVSSRENLDRVEDDDSPDATSYTVGFVDALSWVASGCYDGDLDRTTNTDLAELLMEAGISRLEREAAVLAAREAAQPAGIASGSPA